MRQSPALKARRHAIASPATVRAHPPCCSSFGSAATAHASTLITCNASLILHSVPCPSSQAPPGGWRGIHDAVSPAEALPALWRELQEEGQEQQGQQQQLKYVASGATIRPSNGGSGRSPPLRRRVPQKPPPVSTQSYRRRKKVRFSRSQIWSSFSSRGWSSRSRGGAWHALVRSAPWSQMQRRAWAGEVIGPA